MTKRNILLFDISKVLIITINSKFHLPKMSTSEVIGFKVPGSRFLMSNSEVAPVHIWTDAATLRC